MKAIFVTGSAGFIGSNLVGATLVERSSGLLTLGRVEASFALLSLKRSL